MATIEDKYREKFRRSGELFEEGKILIPGGGHQSRVVRPHPVFVEEAKGAIKWDVDGNELIDYMMGFGALILGHSHPAVTKAVARRLSQGTHMGTLTPLEIRWAELVTELIPSAERVRFTASGTESTLLAMRLARSFTGKTKIVKFRDHFHGWHDYASPESGINTQVGIPEETLETVIVIEPDITELEQLLEREADAVAAVILEPTGAHWGQFPLRNPEFLKNVRDITSKYNVVLIMDEVICGFRISKGGAQERFGVTPDLTTMAKIVAGGLPGGAVAGRSDIMELLGENDPSRRLAHPGTYNANPVSATAGIEVLELIATQPIVEHASTMATRLKMGLRNTLTKMEVVGHVHGIASVVHVALGVECDCDGEICSLSHSQLSKATASPKSDSIKLAMLNEGVDMMGGIGFMVSAVHHEDVIDRTVGAFERALGALREDRVL